MTTCPEPGVERNLQWLQSTYGSLLEFETGRHPGRSRASAVRPPRERGVSLRRANGGYNQSGEPREDFEINALGAMTLLEELRALRFPIPLLFTSTNKVYGDLE